MKTIKKKIDEAAKDTYEFYELMTQAGAAFVGPLEREAGFMTALEFVENYHDAVAMNLKNEGIRLGILPKPGGEV